MTFNYTLIGGFAFNTQALAWFQPFNVASQAFDINNLLSAPFDLDDLAQAIILKLAPHQQTTLIAYSTGGLVAMKIALLRPDLITQLIFINSTPKFIETDAWRGIKYKDAQRLSLKVATLALNAFMRHFTRVAALPHAVNAVDYSRWWSETSQENLTALMTILIETDLRAELKKITAPMVFIHSALDSLVLENPLPYPQRYLQDSTHIALNQSELATLVSSILWP